MTERQPPGIFLGAYIINYGLFVVLNACIH
nr:MAG TPA: hypothetical protein [Caudoviricetes sp.]